MGNKSNDAENVLCSIGDSLDQKEMRGEYIFSHFNILCMIGKERRGKSRRQVERDRYEEGNTENGQRKARDREREIEIEREGERGRKRD